MGFYWADVHISSFFWYSGTVAEPLLKSFPGTTSLTQALLLSAARWQLLPSVAVTWWGLSWPIVLVWPETYSLLLCLRWRTKADWRGSIREIKNIYLNIRLNINCNVILYKKLKKTPCDKCPDLPALSTWILSGSSFPLASFPTAVPSFWLMHAGSVMSFLKTPANNRERRQKRSLEITALCENWRALSLCRVSQVNAALITACQQSFYLVWFIPNP